MPMQVGDRIGQYTVVEHIGRGGMADVWSAQDERLQRMVAIKTIMADVSNESTRSLFEHEARTIAALEHPNILPIYDFGDFQRQLYIVMRYVAGGSLLDHIVDHGALPYDSVVAIAEAVARALERAHQDQIVHRDLKPANVLLDRFGTPYLADFGLAAVIGSGDEEHSSAGTLMYMPPEQMYGMRVDHRADIYAFAIMLFQMLTGEFPFEGQGALCMRQAQFGDELPDPTRYRRDMPEQVGLVLRIATAMDVSARFDSAMMLVAEINAALTGQMAVTGARAPEVGPSQEDVPYQAPTDPSVDEEYIETMPGFSDAGGLETAALGSAELGPLPVELPRPAFDETLLDDPATIADLKPGLLEARQNFQRMVRVWARGQGRFLTGATPFANLHAYYSDPEPHGLVIANAGQEAMLRGAVEHDFGLDFWLAQVPDENTRRLVFLHALRSDSAPARARAVRLLGDIGDTEQVNVTLAVAHLLHAETDPAVRLAVVTLLAGRGAASAAWRPAVFEQDVDLLLAEQALRSDALHVAELAARTVGRLRSAAAVAHIVAQAADIPHVVRRALAWVRDEADGLPASVPSELRRAAFLRLTGQKLAADLPRLGLRYFLALLGTGLGLGLYVDRMFPTSSLLQLAHLYRVVGNAQTFGLVAGLAGTLAAALPLRLAGNASRGATLWPRWARLALGAGLGTLVGAIAYLNFQVLALQYTDPRLGVVLLGGLGLALGAAVVATFRWSLVWRLVGAALTSFAALFGAWRLSQAGTMDAIIFLRGDHQVWLFGVMAVLAAVGFFGPEVVDVLRRRNPPA